MTYTLSNKCAKNLCKRTVLLQLIIKNVVTCFLEHSVYVTDLHHCAVVIIATIFYFTTFVVKKLVPCRTDGRLLLNA